MNRSEPTLFDNLDKESMTGDHPLDRRCSVCGQYLFLWMITDVCWYHRFIAPTPDSPPAPEALES